MSQEEGNLYLQRKALSTARRQHRCESFRRGAPIGPPGLGVGLSIVRHLVELHGGTVDVESPGSARGTVVTMLLPLDPRSRDVRETPARARRPSQTPVRTLT